MLSDKGSCHKEGREGRCQEVETPRAAVAREAAEEVNIKVVAQDLQVAHVMHRKHNQPDGYSFYQEDIYFHTHNYAGTLCNLEPEKAGDVRFILLDNLHKNFSPSVHQAIQCIKKNVIYQNLVFLRLLN